MNLFTVFVAPEHLTECHTCEGSGGKSPRDSIVINAPSTPTGPTVDACGTCGGTGRVLLTDGIFGKQPL